LSGRERSGLFCRGWDSTHLQAAYHPTPKMRLPQVDTGAALRVNAQAESPEGYTLSGSPTMSLDALSLRPVPEERNLSNQGFAPFPPPYAAELKNRLPVALFRADGLDCCLGQEAGPGTSNRTRLPGHEAGEPATRGRRATRTGGSPMRSPAESTFAWRPLPGVRSLSRDLSGLRGRDVPAGPRTTALMIAPNW
jgi:hypothetical protein